MFGVWFQPTDQRMLSWEAASVTCQILFYTLFVPLYRLWQYSNQYCSCSKKVLHTADMQVASLGGTSSQGSTYQAVVDARRVDTVQGWHYYFTYDTIISLMTFIIDIITKSEFAIQTGIYWKNEVKSIHHHARLVLVANRSTINSVWKHQRALPHWRAGSRACVVRVGLTDVGKPAGAHGRTKLIAQVINCFGNSSPFVLPHVICKSKILTYLAIIDIIRISVIIVISVIIKIKCIMSITFSAWDSVLNPIYQNMSSIKWTIFLFNMKICLTTVPLTL
jgi:hypothetical protein